MWATQLEFIVQAFTDLIFRFNREGDFLDYYATKSKLLAAPPNEIIGRNLRDIFEEEIVAKAMACINEALDHNKETSFEYSIRIQNTRHYFEARMVPTNNGDVVSFIRDITDQQLLRRKNADILRSMPDSIFWIDREGVYRDFFAGNEKDLLVDRDRIINSSIYNTFSGHQAAEVMNVIRKALDENEPQSFDYVLSLDGEEKHFESDIVPTDNDIVVVFTRNITNRKRIELRILEQNALLERQNDELLKVNEELDSFIYHASHDLRAPLSSILGLSEIGLKSEDYQEMKSCLTMIKERVKVQDQVIHDIIDYARNIRTSVEPEAFNLKLLIFEIVDTLLFNEGAAEVDFQILIPDNFIIQADRRRLNVVFTNLLSNAIKYHDSEKPSSFVVIKLRTEADRLEIEVADNGIGIAPEHHSKIFSMFYRASHRSKGSGLGLFIVRDSLEKIGGTIRFTSAVGQGTTFIFSIPLPSQN